MYQFKKIYFLLIFFLLSGCSGWERQKVDLNLIEGNSPFRVNQIKGESQVIYKNGLPSEFILNLETCVKDSIRKDVSLQDTSFYIEYKTNKAGKIKTEKLETHTNEDGCLRWSEHYEYKYVTKPLWIGLERTIKREKGAYAGQVFVRVAVNPWSTQTSNSFPNIMDLRPLYYKDNDFLKKYIYKEKGLQFLTDKKLEYPQLWASTIDVQMNIDDEQESIKEKSLITNYEQVCLSEDEKNCFSRKLDMRLTIPLELRTLDIQSQLVDTKINGGIYKIKMQLVSQYPKGSQFYYRIHEKVLEIDHLSMGNAGQADQRTKFLSASFKLKIPYINNNANNKVIIEIESKSLPFKKFQGVYTLGKIDLGVVQKFNIDSSLDEKYKPILDERYKNQKNKVVHIIEEMNIKYIYETAKESLLYQDLDDIPREHIEEFMKKKGFNKSHLNTTVDQVRFSNVKNDEICKTNETVVKRTVQYIGKVCFKDFFENNYEQTIFRIFRQNLKPDGSLDKAMELFKNDEDKSNYSTDAKGCITWSDEINHNNYDRQIYYPRVMHFISQELHLYGQAVIAINPWQEAFQFFQDITQLSQEKIRTNSKGIERPQLVINQFKSINFFPTYIIDKLLNIHFFQNLYFLFQPIVIRPDNVARGKHSRSREFIRDGYYLLRLLVTRSPQETNEHPRIESEGANDKHRQTETYNEKLSPQFREGHYITHVDTVIRAQANFTNMYAPVQFNKEQLYYVGSRNRIILQMVPADPQHFKYKKLKSVTDACELDLQKTKWKPFLSHDLVTAPYAGPFNPQDWVNWNILQPSPHLKTDGIIAQSEEGRERKFFNMDLATCNHNPYLECGEGVKEESGQENQEENHVSLIEGIATRCDSSESDQTDISHCFPKNTNDIIKERINENLNKSVPTKKGKNKLEEFALVNALKIIDLEDEVHRDQFINDLNEEAHVLEKISENMIDYGEMSYQTYGIDKDILNRVPDPKVRQELRSDFHENCFKSEIALNNLHDPHFYQKCIIKRLRTYLKESVEAYGSKSSQNISQLFGQTHQMDGIEGLYYPATPYFRDIAEKLINLIIKPSHFDSLERIIDKGIHVSNSMHPIVGSFAHSLCGFWFNNYFKKYISPKQMRAAYANYVRKNDYYAVLNSNYSSREKNSYFKEILDMVPKEESIKQCHNNYVKCILSDYCTQRDYKDFDVRCSSFDLEKEDRSCSTLLNKKCSLYPENYLCRDYQENSNISQKKCNQKVKLHCENNSQDPICYEYQNKCLVNYYDCTENHHNYFEELVKDDPLNVSKKDFLTRFQSRDPNHHGFKFNKDSLNHPLKSCLDNPFQFFKFENKVLVEDIDDNPTFINGYLSNFSVTSSVSVGSYLNWTAQRSTGITLKTGKSIGKGVYLAGDVTIGMSSNESNSVRRARDVRLGEGIYLLASILNVKIKVSKYKKCLTIKPRVNSFTAYDSDGILKPYNEKYVWGEKFLKKDFKKLSISQTGLIICNPSVEDKENPLEIIENYYYITQGLLNANNSQFLNLYDIGNRPFVIILRGRREFVKMLYLLQNVMEGDNRKIDQNARVNSPPLNGFVHYPHPIEEMVGLHLSIREFNETGFHEGIYTYPSELEDLDTEYLKKKTDLATKIFEFARDSNFLSVPTTPTREIPVQKDY